MKTLQEQMACAQRELALRRNVYPKWIATHKMTQEKADHEIECMKAICETVQLRIELAEISEEMKIKARE